MSQPLLFQGRRSLPASSALLLLGLLVLILSSGKPVLAARLLQPTDQADLQGSVALVADGKTDPVAEASTAAAAVQINRTSKSKASLGKGWRSKDGSLSARPLKPEDDIPGSDSTNKGLTATKRVLQQSNPAAASVDGLGCSGVDRHNFAEELVENEEDDGLLRCIYLQEEGLTNGCCCVIDTWDISSQADISGFTAISQFASGDDLVGTQGLQTWLESLPPTVKAVDLGQLNLTGALPESFGPSSALLEVLWLESNRFTGSLPEKWADELTSLRSLDLSNYNHTDDANTTIWGNNSFSGRLPERWGSLLKSLEFLWCTGGACDGLEGTIPASWSQLCNLSELTFDSSREGWGNNKMRGQLPWLWMYDKPTRWNDIDFTCIPDKIVVGGQIELPHMFCLARGHPAVMSDKFFVHNNGGWGAVVAAGDIAPANTEAVSVSEKLDIWLDPARNMCISYHRFTFIGVVYGVFGFLFLCTVVDLLWRRKASCFACLDPEAAKEAGHDEQQPQHPAIASAVPIAFAGSKLLLVLTDLASDIIATWAIRDTNFVWVFAAMLVVPNVLAALVLHLRLCHITHRAHKWKMLFVPATYKMYQWLYSKGGLALLHASLVFLWPYWLFLQVPILFAASFGRMIGSCGQSKWSMQWLNLPRFCSLLSLIMSCTESPFSAVVFTYFYALGASYQFPTLIKDWNFVLTVGTALLHMLMELWRLMPFIKGGRFKQRMKSLFLDVVVAKQAAADGTVAVEKSVDVAGGMGTAAQQGNKSVEYYYPAEIAGAQGMCKSPDMAVACEGGKVERGIGGESADAGRATAVAGGLDGNIEVAGDGKQQLGKGVVYYYPGEVPGFGGMSTSPDAAVVEEEGVAGGGGSGPVGSAGRGAGRSAPPRAGRGALPRAGQAAGRGAGRGAPPRAGRGAARSGGCGSAE